MNLSRKQIIGALLILTATVVISLIRFAFRG